MGFFNLDIPKELKEQYKHIDDIKKLLDMVEFSNQYQVEISRIAPNYKEQSITSLDFGKFVTKASISTSQFTYEDLIIGSTHIATLSDIEPFNLDLSMIDFEKKEVLNFLTKDNKGKDIMPKDGTFLLPYDYYFNIKISSFAKDVVIFENDVVLSGAINTNYQTSDSLEFMTLDLNFKIIEKSY